MTGVYFLQKNYADGDAVSDDDMDDTENETQPPQEEEEPEIVESDVELDDSDVVDPDNDPPQKVCATQNFQFSYFDYFGEDFSTEMIVLMMVTLDG